MNESALVKNRRIKIILSGGINKSIPHAGSILYDIPLVGLLENPSNAQLQVAGAVYMALDLLRKGDPDRDAFDLVAGQTITATLSVNENGVRGAFNLGPHAAMH